MTEITGFIGLKVSILDVDPDYLLVAIDASNGRFSGSTRIYAGLNALNEFAAHIAGFPRSPEDKRVYEFGSPDQKYAGGYCRLHFYCIDPIGHAKLEIALEDEDLQGRRVSNARFSLFPILAGDLDRFAASLRELQQTKSDDAILRIRA